MSVEKIMDVLDECRRELLGLSGKEIDAVFEEMPIFVACGAQSSGKSAIISRICGFQLPQSSQLCTRVVTEIELRRSEEVSCQVYTTGEGSHRPQTVTMEELPDAIEELQDSLVEGSTSAFIIDRRIVIRLQGPDKLNVTLVDLPGLHSDNDNGMEEVKKLTVDNILRAGALALHVVKGDQDYGSILGADVINDTKTLNRITVLTHCDRVNGNVAERLKPTLQRTEKVSLHTIAVSGLEEYDDEVEDRICNVDPRLEIGLQALKDAVQGCMQTKVQEQLPKVIAIMEKNYSEAKQRLELLARVPEYKIVQKVFNALSVPFGMMTNNLEKHTIREHVERLSAELNGYHNEQQFTPENVIPKIKEFQYNRGTRNTTFADRHDVIVSYAKDFAAFYEVVIRKYLDEVLALVVRGMKNEVWRKPQVPDAGSRIPKLLESDLSEAFEEIRAKYEDHVQILIEGNVNPLAVFTPDETHLISEVNARRDAYNRMHRSGSDNGSNEEHDDPAEADEFELFLSVCAFIKVQSKFIDESACKMIVIFYTSLKNVFTSTIMNDVDKYTHMVTQPPEAQRKAAETAVSAMGSVLPKMKALTRF